MVCIFLIIRATKHSFVWFFSVKGDWFFSMKSQVVLTASCQPALTRAQTGIKLNDPCTLLKCGMLWYINSKTNLSENDWVLVLFIDCVTKYFVNYYSPGVLLSTTVKTARSLTQATQLKLLCALFVCYSVYLDCFMVAYCQSAGKVIQILKFALSSIPEDCPCFSLNTWWWLLKPNHNFCWCIYKYKKDNTKKICIITRQFSFSAFLYLAHCIGGFG